MGEKSPGLGATIPVFLLTLAASLGLAWVSPAEKVLGQNVRLVYLHGAWVWAALILFGLAALAGLGGFLSGRPRLHRWSRALGRTGLIFWIAYLPLSMIASQTNWNGLFLAEPRWRVALVFSVVGILAQSGAALMGSPAWASGVNILYMAALGLSLATAEQVMHPPAPIFSSGSWRIQLSFGLLVLLTLAAAGQITGWWLRRDPISLPTDNAR
jgi:hypothetical protein